jgi:hypothetical protein
MMMMALTNHTNHSKHTHKPAKKKTHNPPTHSRSHSKNTLGNFAQNSVLQRFFLTSKQRNCKSVHTQIFENDDGKNCLLSEHICAHKRRRVLGGDRRGRGESQQQQQRTSIGMWKTRSSRISQPHECWCPSATPTLNPKHQRLPVISLS